MYAIYYYNNLNKKIYFEQFVQANDELIEEIKFIYTEKKEEATKFITRLNALQFIQDYFAITGHNMRIENIKEV